MKVSEIQVKTCKFVNFGTINEADTKRAIREGFKEKEVLQAEKQNMPHFDLYYASNGHLKSRKNALELTNRSAISKYKALQESGFFNETITPDTLKDTLFWLQRIEDIESGIKPPAKPKKDVDNDEYDSYTKGGIFSRSQEREDELYDRWPLGD